MKPKTRILIADDNADVSTDLRILLTLAERVEVIGEAASGRDAIQLAESLRPDIVLMDLEMAFHNSDNKISFGEGLEGIQAIRNIKECRPETIVFVLTVHDYEQAMNAAKEAGADAFLVKGRDTAKLLELIMKYEKK